MGMDYTSAQKALDKLHVEQQHLDQMRAHSGEQYNELILAQAKRVRAASNLAVRALARTRDQLQP